LNGLAERSVDMRLSKEERKTIRSEIPEGLRNVRQMLRTLKWYLDGTILQNVAEESLDLSWSSDISEMEFVDSEGELEAFRPQDDPRMESSSEEYSEREENETKKTFKILKKSIKVFYIYVDETYSETNYAYSTKACPSPYENN
jgi:hypothetical protein